MSLVYQSHLTFLLKKLNHPNVIKLFEVIDDPAHNSLFLVLEYVSDGQLMDRISEVEYQSNAYDGKPIPGAVVTADVLVPTAAAARAFPVTGVTDEQTAAPRLFSISGGSSYVDLSGTTYYTTKTVRLYDDGIHNDDDAGDGQRERARGAGPLR